MSAEWFTHYKPIIFAVVWGLVLALAGAWATDIGEWYKSLQQPAWKPPDWVFGPMWSTIFILAGIAFVMAYHRAPNQETIRMLVILFIVNGLFNFIWREDGIMNVYLRNLGVFFIFGWNDPTGL